jgi:predicted RNA-binding protein with PUA-like domain
MNYWLDLFTPYTWTRFRDHGATISGFRPRQRRTAYERIKPGDYLLCYLVKLSRWSGVLEVVSEAFEDSAPIF